MNPDFSEIDRYVEDRKTQVEKLLKKYISSVRKKHSGLAAAVAHTLLNGKKIRPVLCVAACEAAGGEVRKSLPAACATEMIHAYSLIHDDLPSMDNDDTRRGLPSTHKLFGEATAILAGDLLLSDCFSFLISEGRAAKLPENVLIETVKTLSDSAGKSGMAVGQMMDLENDKFPKKNPTSKIHRLKTGSLIEAAVKCGAIAAGCGNFEPLARYAKNVGLAFQTLDDIIDSDLSERAAQKKLRARRLTAKAINELKKFNGEKTVLKNFALRLCERVN